MVQDRQTDNKFSGVMRSLPEFEPDPKDTAFIIVDMQYLDAHRDYGIGAEAKGLGTTENFDYYFTRVEDMLIPNIQKVQQACRERGIEVIFIKIASLVNDCRDVSPVHKRLQLLAPAKSKEAEILEEIKPLENEIVVIKGCSGAFNGTNLDQILANLGMKTLIFCGVATNYCVRDLGPGCWRPGLQRHTPTRRLRRVYPRPRPDGVPGPERDLRQSKVYRRDPRTNQPHCQEADASRGLGPGPSVCFRHDLRRDQWRVRGGTAGRRPGVGVGQRCLRAVLRQAAGRLRRRRGQGSNRPALAIPPAIPAPSLAMTRTWKRASRSFI